MANTTNFGWETPDDTDLVKDGAAAIRTLGSAIDASLVDLKGGTTGQVLSKATNTDMDFTWVAQDDNNAIQNALLTTTGDTIYASGASTPARLGIGSTGQVLTVAGGVPTWAAPSGGGSTFVGCKVYNDISISISLNNNTITTITWANEYFDTDAIHSTTSNTSRFTVPTGKGGKWALTCNLHYAANATGQRQIRLKKNGTFFNNAIMPVNSTADTAFIYSDIFNLTAGDYLEIDGYQNSGGSLAVNSGDDSTCAFYYLGA